MTNKEKLIQCSHINKNNQAGTLMILNNEVLSDEVTEQIKAKVKTEKNNIFIDIEVPEEVKIKKPVHVCFGALNGDIQQDIVMNIHLGKNSKVNFLSDCVLTSEDKVRHVMKAEISLDEGAECRYVEKHMHNDSGSIYLSATATLNLAKDSWFKYDFNLLQGRAGKTWFDYAANLEENASLDMETRLKAFKDDKVTIKETASLEEKGAKSVLKSRVAASDESEVEIFNTITAKADKNRGHIDCQEILLGNGKVKAYPNAEVLHPKAQVTHEASLGGLDNSKLETLMARGNSEQEAERILLQGLLARDK